MASLVDTYGMPSKSVMRTRAGACRYVSHTSGKNVTSAQVKQLHDWGKTVVLNFEDGAADAQGGYSAGVADGKFFVQRAHALGAPKGVAGYFSVDYEIHSNFGTVDAYVRGITSQLRPAGYKVGIYGCYSLIKHLFDSHLIDYGWQCAAWSYGDLDARAHLYQDEYTQGWDRDIIKHANYGAWTNRGAQPSPTAAPTDWLSELNEAEARKLMTEIADARIDARVNTKIQNGLLFTLTGKPHGRWTAKNYPLLDRAAHKLRSLIK